MAAAELDKTEIDFLTKTLLEIETLIRYLGLNPDSNQKSKLNKSETTTLQGPDFNGVKGAGDLVLVTARLSGQAPHCVSGVCRADCRPQCSTSCQ